MSSGHQDEVRDYGFSDKALALRKRADLTQRELADLLGVSALGPCLGGWSLSSRDRAPQATDRALP
jgi:transcriptional regulator with XRE-family HTH domain